MATPEALIKYYDCLRDSFNRIQDKDKEEALVNAALRPKIRDELAKSRQLLDSYLNYIKVFSLIYSDKFNMICSNIIVPLFNTYGIKVVGNEDDPITITGETEVEAVSLHESMQAIIAAKPELAEDFVHNVVRKFPTISNTEHEKSQAFLVYMENCLRMCSYLKGEPLLMLVAKLLEKLNAPLMDSQEEELEDRGQKFVDKSYELIYGYLDNLDADQLEQSVISILIAYTRDFLDSPTDDNLNYLIFYACSLNDKFADFLINILWEIFTNTSKPLEERRVSVNFASSLISRANFVNLDKVFNYLEAASNWCEDYLDDNTPTIKQEGGNNENVESFYALAQSMFYLITQRYREMYEEESIAKLAALNLDKIIRCPLRPLEASDIEIQKRFQEIATLYHITNYVTSVTRSTPAKRRKSEVSYHQPKGKSHWKVPFRETCKSMPSRIQPLYRTYYDHRNFTIFRE